MCRVSIYNLFWEDDTIIRTSHDNIPKISGENLEQLQKILKIVGGKKKLQNNLAVFQEINVNDFEFKLEGYLMLLGRLI
jgi:uncharacterized protein YdiU (UPF0061 family)